ncbi:MAG: hypothetical protein WC724_01670 [Candidatus Paceibacterota bacterium]|jgi:hypothetical protein
MRFTQGCTRLVILTETIAIKIALPFRPFIPFIIVIQAILRGDLKRKLEKHNGNLLKVLVRCMTIAGIDANRREMRISTMYPEYPIARVLRSYLWGFVIVMTKGEQIAESLEPWVINQLSLPDHLQKSDLFKNDNTCCIDGRFHFVDYGDPSADEVLPLLFGTRSTN